MVPKLKTKTDDGDQAKQPVEEPSPAPKLSFNEYLLTFPKIGDLDTERNPDTGRDVDLSDFV